MQRVKENVRNRRHPYEDDGQGFVFEDQLLPAQR